MNELQADEIIQILKKILAKIGRGEPAADDKVPTPIKDRPRTKRYPARVDQGTVFRSKPGHNWICPYCNRAILEGDMVVAFQAKPDARTTYAHLECDDEENKQWE